MIDRQQLQKKKETKNTIKLDMCSILGGMQQCNFWYNVQKEKNIYTGPYLAVYYAYILYIFAEIF